MKRRQKRSAGVGLKVKTDIRCGWVPVDIKGKKR